MPVQLRSRILRAALNSSSAAGFVHKENDHAGAFLLLHGRYSVLSHYLKVSLKNSRFLKIPKLHPQKGGVSLGVRQCEKTKHIQNAEPADM